MSELPFSIKARFENDTATFLALIDDEVVASERYKCGNGDRRRKVAALWVGNERLQNGSALDATDIEAALLQKETEVIESLDAAAMTESAAAAETPKPKPEQPDEIERASYVDDNLIVELAWSFDTGRPDFIVFDRQTQRVTRADSVTVPGGVLIAPSFAHGVLTPAYPIPGTVFVPSEYDESGIDETRLRHDLEHFVRSYVEFSDDTTKLAIEYILMSWIYDGFDELAYLVFKTADAGRGKSRALDSVGTVCYRPIFCGGGSSSAATLRLLDTIGGTLVADEFDQKDTELASELNKILCQGFQRGRPLVRCDGENNAPRAFNVYGPKLFACRKGFSDDAVESRCVVVRMKQRTRRDIPISLPRREFDRRALSLRNRLLAWRCARLGKITIDPSHADPRLEDRQAQIGLPLLAIAGTEDGRGRVIAALLEQQDNVAADRSDTLACLVFEAAMGIAQPGDTVFCGDVSNEVNRRRAAAEGVELDKLRKPTTSHRVGKVLRQDLEFTRGTRTPKGIPYRLSPERAAQLQVRFGVPPSTSTLSTQVHSTASASPETTLFGTENAGNALAVHNALAERGAATSTDGVHADATSNDPAGPTPVQASASNTQVHPPADDLLSGLVPSHWKPGEFIDHLEKKAAGCDAKNPELAGRHRSKAAAIRAAAGITATETQTARATEGKL